MSLPIPEDISLETLPWLSLDSLKHLPSIPALYFLVDAENCILYIGRSQSLRQRWQAHHVLHKVIDRATSLRLLWYQVETPEILIALEKACLDRWKPVLNGRHIYGPQGVNDMSLPSTFGQRVRYRRIQLGWTQEKLASLLGVRQNVISRFEDGSVKSPHLNMFRKLARVLGVTADYLVGMYDEDPTEPLVAAVGR